MRELKRLGFDNVSIKELANLTNCKTEDDLLASLGNGDIKISQALGALQRLKHPPQAILSSTLQEINAKHDQIAKSKTSKNAEITVAGIDNLLSHMARCCKPIPGDEIIGYITLGEGVSIHRQDCINVLQVSEAKKARLTSS